MVVEKRLGNADEVAEILGIPKRSVYERSRSGAFDGFLVVLGDRPYRYDLLKLEEFIRNGGLRGAAATDQ